MFPGGFIHIDSLAVLTAADVENFGSLEGFSQAGNLLDFGSCVGCSKNQLTIVGAGDGNRPSKVKILLQGDPVIGIAEEPAVAAVHEQKFLYLVLFFLAVFRSCQCVLNCKIGERCLLVIDRLPSIADDVIISYGQPIF